MKYFLTGATGFVGGRVARMLRDAGHDVNALIRSPDKNPARALAELGVQIAPGDVTDKASMREPMEGVDGVFHIAAWYKVGARDTSPAERVNVDGTRNVLELMKELAIPKGVYTSTLGVNSNTDGEMVDESYRFDGEHLSVYERTKADAHKIAERFIADGLPLVIVMPGLIYGPGDTSQVRETLIQYLQGKLPMIPRQTAYCWAHVDDIAEAHIIAMEKAAPGSTYIIAGPPHTLVEAMTIAQEITGKRAPKAAPAGIFKSMAQISGVVEKVIPLPPMYGSEGLRALGGVTYLGDNGKAKRELGYNPRSLQEGIEETLRHEMKLLGMG